MHLTSVYVLLVVSVLPLKNKLLNLFPTTHRFYTEINSSLRTQTLPLSLRSAGITALGICLLLRADHYITMILAGALAVLSKFLFQVRRQHFFNPANFGIISALILTPDAWVSPVNWSYPYFRK